MMRNTSPVGWIPLLAIKVLNEGSLLPFIISAIAVAVPLIGGIIYIDTIYYQSDKWVLTGYNFLEMNILHGLSKYFGEDPWWMYITTAFAAIFILMVPLAYYSIPRHFKVQW
jgi:hypothetical protein